MTRPIIWQKSNQYTPSTLNYLLRSTIACKSGTATLGHTVKVFWNNNFPINIFSLLVGVEVCEGVLDHVGENDLLQVIHLAMKS